MRTRDIGFRLGTGVFGLIVVAVVVAMGFELTRQSTLAIEKFGINFWRTQTWDPVAGQFGAFPFIWGTLYSSILALIIATPVALGIAIFIAEFSPARVPGTADVPHRTAGGDSVNRVRAVGDLRAGPSRAVPAARNAPSFSSKFPLFAGPPRGVGMLSAGLILAVMIIPFTSSVAREVLNSVPAAQREGAYALGATRLEAIRAALFFARTGIVGAVMLGFRPRVGRDHGCDHGDWEHPTSVGVLIRASIHDGRCAGQRIQRGRSTIYTFTRWLKLVWCCSRSP